MATKNRLNLDYTIRTQSERAEFVNKYMSQLTFQPTDRELQVIADYMLWGENSEGKNLKQEGLAQLETRHKTWDSPHQDESLDALLENPAFSENVFKRKEEPVYKTPKVKLDRDEVRRTAPPALLEEFEKLWVRIDQTDLQIELYELSIGKRTLEIRKELLDRFEQAELTHFGEVASRLTPNDYIKLRHQLVELRREQYTFKDLYNSPITRHTERPYGKSAAWTFEQSIQLRPLASLKRKDARGDFYAKVWTKNQSPDLWTQEELKQLSDFLWKEDKSDYRSDIYFDFGDAEHLYAAFQILEELEDMEAALEDPESNLGDFLETIQFYAAAADLDQLERDLLEEKIRKTPNADIAAALNKRYNKHYNCNYISTLWCKRILGEIANAAKIHREELELVFFPEEWKKCTCCGKMLVRDTRNFMRKKNSGDGLAARCKKCEKQKRLEREGKI